jgi:signal transduction histidine kinase
MTENPPVLLNVDDCEPARYSRTRILRMAGFDVHEAATGADALELIRSTMPDIVLLDVHLPDMSGIDVCRSVKSATDAASPLVLQISASAISAPQATEALNSGADCYVVEPVEPEVLVATVRALLRIRRAERELARSNEALREANVRLNEVNAALRRSNEDLEHFAYVASHDLQEPLRAVTTYVQLLERLLGEKLDERARELFGFVVDGARRMSALIDGVLAYSRIGRSDRKLDTVSLEEAVCWAMQNLKQGLQSAGGEVSFKELPEVWGDSVQLAQVFQNLIGNSIKYRSPVEPLRIAIEAQKVDGNWVISVRDNGIGIAPRFQEQVFHPFKRLHGGDIPGAGIGLALCRRIIEAHGGRLWVESEEGRGSAFFFTLVPATTAFVGHG